VIKRICSVKANKSVTLLKRLSRNIDRKTKLHIYKTFIRPKLEYANIVYGNNLSQAQADLLENTQRQALLSCSRAYRHTSHARLLQETGIEPLTFDVNTSGCVNYIE
jgi:hypothetical protein